MMSSTLGIKETNQGIKETSQDIMANIDIEELTSWVSFKNAVFTSLYDCDPSIDRQYFEEETMYFTRQLVYDIYLPRSGLNVRSTVYRETLRSTLGYTNDVQKYIEQIIIAFTDEWKRANNNVDIIYNELAVLENYEREILRMLGVKKRDSVVQCKCCASYNDEKAYVVRRRIDEIYDFVIPGLSPRPHNFNSR
jgi:hypothetical protein